MCCCNCDLSRYMTPACWAFFICTLISSCAFMVSVLGLAGVLKTPGYECYYAITLSTVISFWMSPPKLKSVRGDDNTPNDTVFVRDNILRQRDERRSQSGKQDSCEQNDHEIVLNKI